jgi:arylsulfatase A-like enzyme
MIRQRSRRSLRNSVCCAGLCLWFTALSSFAGEASDPQAKRQLDPRPNILFVLLDDMGEEWVSAYGSQSITTPGIDRLAGEGIRFDNAWSNPQCTPTRLTFMTGQYPYQHGWVNHWDVPRWGHGYYDWELNPSIARVMKESGYATAAAGKWQVNDFRIEPEAMVKHGFDDYAMWTGWEEGVPASAERYWDPYIHTAEGSKTYEGEFGTDVFVEFLETFISENRSGPWFAYLAAALPHPPYVTTPAKPDVDGDRERYIAMVEYADLAIARLTDHIDALGLAEQTLIVITSDNGGPRKLTANVNGRPVKGGKTYTSENGIAVPLVTRWKGHREGLVSKALVDFTDFMPTFAALAGASLPDNTTIDGMSFAGVLSDGDMDGPREWIMAMGGRNEAAVSEVGVENKFVFRDRVLRDRRYKLYLAATADLKAEKFFDLQTDPHETRNMIGALDMKSEAAFQNLMEVAKQFPRRDNDPKYRRRAASEWDVPVTVNSQQWKLDGPQATTE